MFDAIDSAARDDLTGAYARAAFAQQLDRCLDTARRLNEPVSLLVFDLDHFKSINDAFGHTRGDQALIQVVRRVQDTIRSSDLLFRYGGDEFVLLVPAAGQDAAIELGHRILEVVSAKPFDKDGLLTMTLSIGVATFPSDAKDGASLFEIADARNLEAKRRGRARIVAEDRSSAPDLPFAQLSRLVERDEAFATVTQFLQNLPERGQGLLSVSGATGTGRTRLLEGVAQRARLQGYEVIALHCSQRLSTRPYAAMVAALDAVGLTLQEAPSSESLINVLRSHMERVGSKPLLICVDDLPLLDWDTLQWLRKLFGLFELPVLGVVCASIPSAGSGAPTFGIPYIEHVRLLPFSTEGLQVWLRMLLQWEPPEEFLSWIGQCTGNVASRVEQLLKYLVSQGALIRVQDQWCLREDYRSVAGDEVNRLRYSATPNNLPAQLSSFIGREDEIEEIVRALGKHRMITLTGSGGTGKTRLALQVATQVKDSLKDGAWFVELASIVDGSLVPHTIASALGVRAERGRPMMTTLVEWIKDKELLLVIDNCEHLLDACANCAQTLLQANTSLRLLVTSRESIGMSGEMTWRVPSLTAPDAQAQIDVEALMQYASVRLFVERAQQAQALFMLTQSTAPAVVHICQRLDGIPLAIELAAARLSMLPVEQIARRLDDAFQLLSGGSRSALPRQRTLRSMIDWSYELLNDSERIAMRRLAVFKGGWTLEAAEAALSGDGVESGEILALLSRLIDKSLVSVEERLHARRYRMLETISQYAREKLVDFGEEDQMHDRHLQVMLDLAECSEPLVGGHEQQHWLDELEADIDNMRAALDWAQASDPHVFMRLASALWRFWDLRGHVTEGADWLSRALTLNAGRNTSTRALALARAAYMARNQEDYERAEQLALAAIDLSREVDASPALAMGLFVQGASALEFNRPEQGAQLLRQALELFLENGNHGMAGTILVFLGFEAEMRNELGQARELVTQGLQEARASGDRRRIAHALVRLGFVALGESDVAAAGTLFEEALTLARAIGDKAYIGNCLFLLGRTALFRGDYQRARQMLEEPQLLDRTSAKAEQGWALVELAKLELAQQDLMRCTLRVEQALAIGRPAGIRELEATALYLGGQVARIARDWTRARTCFTEAVELFKLSRREGLCLCLEGFAGLLLDQGQAIQAARLFGSREKLRKSLAVLDHYPFMQSQRDAHINELRQQLGEEDFQREWSKGQSLSEDDALALALA